MWYPTAPTQNYTESIVINEDPKVATVVGSVSCAVLLVMVAIGTFLIRRYRQLRAFLSKDEVYEFFKGRVKPIIVKTDADYVTVIGHSEFNREFELSKSQFCIGNIRKRLLFYLSFWLVDLLKI